MGDIKNIAIGKVGKSVKFDSSKWSGIGGDNEAPNLFMTIAKMNPNINFYMIGKSDLRLLKPEVKKQLNIPSNIIDVWEGFKSKIHDETKYAYEVMSTKYKNVKIDCGVYYNGPASYTSIPNLLRKDGGAGGFYTTLDVFRKYVGPITYFENMTNVPFFTLGPDPRYIPIGARDLIHREKFVLSQYETTEKVKHMTSLEDQTLIESYIPVEYSGIEKVFFLGREKQDITWIPKKKKMMIVLNEGGNGGLKRGPMLQEYILNQINDVEIYGKWSDEWYSDNRFKGPKGFVELQPMLEDVKYTFIIPIQKGWVTAKFWEMINYGVIPFMHPFYDQQKHIKCPDFLRVSGPCELVKKIEYLEKNPNKYNELLNELNKMLKEEYYNGEFINNLFMDGVKRVTN